MKVRLTLQEKLQDLRDGCKLKLQEVADATYIPLTTVQYVLRTATIFRSGIESCYAG